MVKATTNVRHVIVESCKVAREKTDGTNNTTNNNNSANTISKPISCTWPLGDCGSNERLTAEIPITSIRKEAKNGGNVHIVWKPNNDNNIGDDKDNTNKIQPKIFGLYRGDEAEEETNAKDTKATTTEPVTGTTTTTIDSSGTLTSMSNATKRKEVPVDQNGTSNKHSRIETED